MPHNATLHHLTNTKPIDMGSLGILSPGEWLVNDQNAFELGLRGARGDVRLREISFPGCADTVCSIFLIRCGAWGDLLYLTPAIRALREKYPNAAIRIASFPQHHALFEGNPHVQAIETYPVKASSPLPFDLEWTVNLEDCMEVNPGVHATDAFAQALGVTVTDYKPVYVLKDDEVEFAKRIYPKGERPRVGLQCKSSRITRDYPFQLWGQAIDGLIKRGWEIYLFGSPGQVKLQGTPEHVINLTEKNLTFRESAAILSTMDAFCGVDSALLPLCHALDKPAIGLYGPFPWESRTGKAPLTRAISGNGPCAPCFWHTHAGRHFPPNCPSQKFNFCGVLADIPPERIISKIDALKP